MNLRPAKVIAVHPERHTVDIVFSDTGQRVAEVQVIGDAGSDAGSWSVPNVPKPTSEATPDVLTSGRNLVAAVATVAGIPVVTGFLRPEGTQMTFSEQNRTVRRHASGAYTTIAPDGSIEVFHPSGAFLRIGSGGHQDLAAISADGNWSIPAGAPNAQVTLATQGFSLTILPNGATTLQTTGELHMTYAKAVLTGDVAITGALTATGEITAMAGGASSVTLSQHKGHTGGAMAPTPGT